MAQDRRGSAEGVRVVHRCFLLDVNVWDRAKCNWVDNGMRQEYLDLAHQLNRLNNMKPITTEENAAIFMAITSTLGRMHIILQEEYFALEAENKLLRARIDADSPIGTIRNN